MRGLLAAGVVALAALAGSAQAQTPPPAPPVKAAATPNDYNDKANWLCLPGRADACANDNTTTVVKADGSTTVETWKADPKAPVDCFYVYPTVSRDPSLVSDMTANAEEVFVVQQQAARLGIKCRVFAPLYRQVTLPALTAFMSGKPMPGSMEPWVREVGYDDVRDAWRWYLAHENHGRGVVLLGHSQGSGVLTRLIAEEIDGKPVQKQVISAWLMGASVPVAQGKDVGGAFKSVPLCHSTSQTGCVVAYPSFRDTSPPSAGALFGKPFPPQPGTLGACVNPAALGGGVGQLHSYLTNLPGRTTTWTQGKTITTPFVSTPGLLTAECKTTPDGYVYLSIHINADPADPRTDTLAGDVMVGGQIQKGWGLHLVDVNIAMGNVLEDVGLQSAAWLKARR
ncbi:MAG: hypothetical protein JWP35_3602 [Caulobacter sp.]|nr:hypothetical protein [Caulobacter sp.]